MAHRFTVRDIEFIMLLSIQAGLFSATGAAEPTEAEGWRDNATESALSGPMDEERSLLLLAMTRCTFRRGNNWPEHLKRMRASVEVLGIMLEVTVHESRDPGRQERR
ncbi:hypothetical protein TRAPUB_5420 [Trametes pubescens]|uniref:Uncharacterized protein n=1 Tax=Trametes pubescens TaxID=154538 RepID=A0A1M2V8I0_TRAPU|nr:hypothetical protein TRAPUB_5420 [Trametes pubescens]